MNNAMKNIRPASIHVAPGTQGTYSGFAAAVIRHYDGNMYEIRVPGGPICVGIAGFVPDVPSAEFNQQVAAYRAACAAAR